MNTQELMKLADAFAYACADMRKFLGANAGMDEADGTWITLKMARAALQSALEALEAENLGLRLECQGLKSQVAEVTSYWKEAARKNRRMLEENADLVAAEHPVSDGQDLWIWQNGDHMLAFTHLYPCFTEGGDPMTLGEPVARAIFRASHSRSIKEGHS